MNNTQSINHVSAPRATYRMYQCSNLKADVTKLQFASVRLQLLAIITRQAIKCLNKFTKCVYYMPYNFKIFT